MAIGLDEALRVAHNGRERAGGPHSEPGGLAMQALMDSAAVSIPAGSAGGSHGEQAALVRRAGILAALTRVSDGPTKGTKMHQSI